MQDRCVPAKPAGRHCGRISRAAAGLLLAALGSATLAAELPAQLPDGLRRCAGEDDDRRRLACYDAEIARLDGAAADPAAVVAAPDASTLTAAAAAAAAGSPAASAPPGPSAAPAVPAGDPEDRFGRRGDLDKEAPLEASEVSSTVAAAARRADGRFVVTLENGQTWREVTPNPSVRLQAGDPVRIERGALGSFVLIAPNKRSTKVTRIK